MRPDDPLRWILVKPQMEIEAWAVDLLLMDQHSCPTLVEVKRGDNREGRRAVVGQMLDYASAVAAAWSGDAMRVAFEQDAVHRGSDPHEELRTLLDYPREADIEKAANAFWERAAANLEAGRLRLLFVADNIPSALERSVTFWNAQTKESIEVLAVEVKQYPGKFGDALVSRVIGQIDTRGQTSTRMGNLNRKEFLELFPRTDARIAIESLIGAAERFGTNVKVRPARASFSIHVESALYPSSIPLIRILVPSGTYPDGRIVFFHIGDADYPERVAEVLGKWVSKFGEDAFTANAPDSRDIGVAVDADNFVSNIDVFIDRLLGTLSDLTNV